MFYAEPPARATVAASRGPTGRRVRYFPSFPSSCASSGKAW
jgi:hypothetical protein